MPTTAENIGIYRAIQYISQNDNANQEALGHLASGRRINNPADDAAGLAIAQSLWSDVVTLGQAGRNATDGASLIGTATANLENVVSALTRMKELAEEAANGTQSDATRAASQLEFGALSSEIDRIHLNTTYNGVTLFSGTPTFTFQVGITSAGDSQVAATISPIDTTTLGIDVANVTTQTDALAALDLLTNALATIAQGQATLGAASERMTHVKVAIGQTQAALQTAHAAIMDADMAEESAKYARTNIISQIALSVLSQANRSGDNLITLFR